MGEQHMSVMNYYQASSVKSDVSIVYYPLQGFAVQALFLNEIWSTNVTDGCPKPNVFHFLNPP